MPTAANRLVAEFVDAWNAHDVDRIAECYAETYEGDDVAERGRRLGKQGIRQSVVQYLGAFPDCRLTVDNAIAQRDRVALFWTARGAHRGTFMNIPPTGRTLTIRGSSLLVIQDAKIVRGLHIWAVAGSLGSLSTHQRAESTHNAGRLFAIVLIPVWCLLGTLAGGGMPIPRTA